MNRKMRVPRPWAWLSISALFAALGCSGIYYDAMESMGKHKRHILRDRVDAGREEQKEAEEQFQTAYERFKEASGYDGGDLEPVYERLNGEYERSVSRAEAVRDRIASAEDVAGHLFEEWQQEIEQISSPPLAQSSGQRLRDTRAQYGQLMAAMKRAESKMDPVLVAFRDQVLFLKHNLNAQAIAALDSSVREIEDEVADLIGEIRTSVREAERFSASLGS